MSSYLTSLITPANVDAAADLSTEDAAYLATSCRRLAAAQAGDRVPAEDVASVAVLQAAGMVAGGHSLSTAAAAAVRVAMVAALRDTEQDTRNVGGSLDDVDTEGQPRLRLASPYAPDPAAPYRTTTGDRYARSLASLDGLDGVTAHALLSAEWKGGKVPAAAVRRALDLPPVTGRAGTAWTREVTEDAARVLPALQDAYRALLTEDAQGTEAWQPSRTYGTPRTRRTVDADAVKVDRAEKLRPADDARRTEDTRGTSGPASAVAVVSRRALDRLGVLDGSTRRRATEQDARVTPPASLTVAAYARPASSRKAEDDAAAWMPDAEQRTGRRAPGVTVDADGVAVAQAGQPGSGLGSGSGPAVPRPVAPRKASRSGGTGPTVPTGPRR